MSYSDSKIGNFQSSFKHEMEVSHSGKRKGNSSLECFDKALKGNEGNTQTLNSILSANAGGESGGTAAIIMSLTSLISKLIDLIGNGKTDNGETENERTVTSENKNEVTDSMASKGSEAEGFQSTMQLFDAVLNVLSQLIESLQNNSSSQSIEGNKGGEHVNRMTGGSEGNEVGQTANDGIEGRAGAEGTMASPNMPTLFQEVLELLEQLISMTQNKGKTTKEDADSYNISSVDKRMGGETGYSAGEEAISQDQDSVTSLFPEIMKLLEQLTSMLGNESSDDNGETNTGTVSLLSEVLKLLTKLLSAMEETSSGEETSAAGDNEVNESGNNSTGGESESLGTQDGEQQLLQQMFQELFNFMMKMMNQQMVNQQQNRSWYDG